MQTVCCQSQIEFQELSGRKVVTDFEGGTITSDAGLLLLREVDLRLGIVSKVASAFRDGRDAQRAEHTVEQLLRQRILAIAAGYEDLADHDRLRHDPLMAVVAGKCDPTGCSRRQSKDRGKACAGKSTLNRLELSPDLAVHQAQRYHKISWDEAQLDQVLIDIFLSSFREVPAQLILDLDATDDPLHGDQEGRFFHGYYGNYCYLPLYIFCGGHLLCARLRKSDIDGCAGWKKELSRIVNGIRERFPQTQIIVRGDSGFCREELMVWCEAQPHVDYVLGLARNPRLESELAPQLEQASKLWREKREPVRLWKDFQWSTKETWSKDRRVVGKAEWIDGGENGKANPRFIVTTLSAEAWQAQSLYERLYCARGDMENRIKEQQLDLFADRTSTGFIKSNQLRLYFSSLAYVLVHALRERALGTTRLAKASAGTIRTRLFKAGAVVRISVRRVLVSISSGWPMSDVFCQAMNNLAMSFG